MDPLNDGPDDCDGDGICDAGDTDVDGDDLNELVCRTR